MARYGAYVAGKGAVEQLNHILAQEPGQRQITVNAVSPGATDTKLFSEDRMEAERQRIARMAEFGRLGQPRDIANVMALLCTDNAGWDTCQNVRANGGPI